MESETAWGMRLYKVPYIRESKQNLKEIRNTTGTTVLGHRAVRHAHQTGTDLDYVQIHFQTQVMPIRVKTNTV